MRYVTWPHLLNTPAPVSLAGEAFTERSVQCLTRHPIALPYAFYFFDSTYFHLKWCHPLLIGIPVYRQPARQVVSSVSAGTLPVGVTAVRRWLSIAPVRLSIQDSVLRAYMLPHCQRPSHHHVF